jgi:hydrogenase maturation factor
MRNYMIHFTEAEREAVLNIIARSNDIVLNSVEPEAAFVTIQLEDEEAELLHAELLAQIDREVRAPEVVVVTRETYVTDTNPPTIVEVDRVETSRRDPSSDTDRPDHRR